MSCTYGALDETSLAEDKSHDVEGCAISRCLSESEPQPRGARLSRLKISTEIRTGDQTASRDAQLLETR